MVVATAMATIMVKRFWLSAPIDSPIVATITSVEPRAFMPQASASDSRRLKPPISPPMNAPANFPTLAITISPSAISASCGSRRTVRSVDKPAMPKNTGMKKRENEAAQLLVDVLAQDRRFADQHAGDKRTQYGVHADEMRRQRHRAHDHEDGRDHGEVALEIVVRPSDQEEDERGVRR